MALFRRRPVATVAVLVVLAVVVYVGWSLFFSGGTHFDPEMR